MDNSSNTINIIDPYTNSVDSLKKYIVNIYTNNRTSIDNYAKLIVSLLIVITSSSMLFPLNTILSALNSFNRITTSLTVTLFVLCYNRLNKTETNVIGHFRAKCIALYTGYAKLHRLVSGNYQEPHVIKAGFESIFTYIDVNDKLNKLKLQSTDIVRLQKGKAFVNIDTDSIHNKRNRDLEKLINRLDTDEIMVMSNIMSGNNDDTDEYRLNIHTTIYRWIIIKLRIVLTQMYALRSNNDMIHLDDYNDLMGDINDIMAKQYDDIINRSKSDRIIDALLHMLIIGSHIVLWCNNIVLITSYINGIFNNKLFVLSAPLWITLLIILRCGQLAMFNILNILNNDH